MFDSSDIVTNILGSGIKRAYYNIQPRGVCRSVAKGITRLDPN